MKTACMVLQMEDPYQLAETIKNKQNEFLDLYSLYRSTRIAWIHDELKLKAYELHLIDPSFRVRI